MGPGVGEGWNRKIGRRGEEEKKERKKERKKKKRKKKKKKREWCHFLTFVVDHSVLVALNGPHELVNLPVGELLTEGGENYRRGGKEKKEKEKKRKDEISPGALL